MHVKKTGNNKYRNGFTFVLSFLNLEPVLGAETANQNQFVSFDDCSPLIATMEQGQTNQISFTLNLLDWFQTDAGLVFLTCSLIIFVVWSVKVLNYLARSPFVTKDILVSYNKKEIDIHQAACLLIQDLGFSYEKCCSLLEPQVPFHELPPSFGVVWAQTINRSKFKEYAFRGLLITFGIFLVFGISGLVFAGVVWVLLFLEHSSQPR